MKGPTRRTTLRAGALLGVLLAAFDARAGELTSSELLIRDSRLLITPAEQTTAPGMELDIRFLCMLKLP